MKTNQLKNLAVLLLLAGMFYACTTESIEDNFRAENEEFAEWKHFDTQEWELLYGDHYQVGLAVEFRLKPQIGSRTRNYSIAADVEVKALSSKHNATLRPSFPGTRDPVLQQYYTLIIRGDYMSVKSRERGENRAKYEAVIGDFLAIGKFENYVREFGIYSIACANPVSVNDPYFLDTWHGWALRMINAPCAWTITRGNPNVLIGVADTEFRITHEEFQAFQNAPNQFASVLGQSSSNHHHGTEVASVAAARANNGRGIAGIAHNSRIAAHRIVHYPNGDAYGHNISAAINNLHNAGVRIINVSWHGTGLSRVQAERITQGGTTLVVSAGNNNNQQWHSYIATVPGVIVVSSVDRNNRHGGFPEHARNPGVTIVAPGREIRIAGGGSDNQYLTRGGTSFAAPFVAGTVALMRSVNSTLAPAQIEHILRATADPIADGGLFPGQLGAGRLNAFRAVEAALGAAATISGPTHFCTSATYSIAPLPAGWSVTWTVRRTRDEWHGVTITTQTFTTPTITLQGCGSFSESLEISATMRNASGAIVATPTFHAINGAPSPHTGVLALCNGIFGIRDMSPYYWVRPVMELARGEHLLSLRGFMDFARNWHPNVHLFRAELSSRFGHIGQVSIRSNTLLQIDINGLGNETGYLDITLRNACGMAHRHFRIPVRILPPWFFGFALRHCPTSGTLSIEIDTEGFAEMRTYQAATNSRDVSPTYDIRLYCARGYLLQQTSTRSNRINLNVADLPDGFYFLRICDGILDNPITQGFVIGNDTDFVR